MPSSLQCIDCAQQYPIQRVIYACDACGGLLDVRHDLGALRNSISAGLFDERLGTFATPYNSGVWRFKELVYPGADDDAIVSRMEGNTNLYELPRVAAFAGVDTLFLKHEGENPTGSFKDRGMTTGVTQAQAFSAWSAWLARQPATPRHPWPLMPRARACKASYLLAESSRLLWASWRRASPTARHVYKSMPISTATWHLVRRSFAQRLANLYSELRSIPFGLEGSKDHYVRSALQQLRWQVPDWIVLPGGNLGNSSAFGKGLLEMLESRLDRPHAAPGNHSSLEGANPLYRHFSQWIQAISKR